MTRGRCALGGTLAFVMLLAAGCEAAVPHPSTVDDVRRAFASDDIRLVEAPGGRNVWGTLLAAHGEKVSFDVQVFVDAEGARQLAGSLGSLAAQARTLPRLGDRPSQPPPVGTIERRANVVVVVPASATDELARRIASALGRLPER